MSRKFFFAVAGVACAVLLTAPLKPTAADDEFPQYTHQDYNSPAARALRQEIMNRAILRQATHGRSGKSYRAHSMKQGHRRVRAAAKRRHRA